MAKYVPYRTPDEGRVSSKGDDELAEVVTKMM